jgi:hypothetical protein
MLSGGSGLLGRELRAIVVVHGNSHMLLQHLGILTMRSTKRSVNADGILEDNALGIALADAL